MGKLDSTLKGLASVFTPTPLQKAVTSMSFVIEDPSIHYSTKLKFTLPSESTPLPFCSDMDTFDFTGSQTLITSPSDPDSTPYSQNLTETPPVFNHTQDMHDILGFHIKRELESPPPPLPELTFDLQQLSHPEISNELNFMDDPSFADFDLGDFTKDFEVSETLNVNNAMSYHTALIQVPLRDQSSAAESHSNHPTSEENYDDDETSFIYIPKSLEFLPDLLKEVPLYRDLFHHFVYVSADFLVPAPLLYPQNPFKTLLPPMALGTPHLLALILAYAATHRANFLRLPSPVDVVKRLLSRVFQGLTKSLENEQEAISDITLTTAIMLTSYDILTDSVDSSWKKHLHGARDIVVARGLAQPLLDSPDGSPSEPNSRSTSFSDYEPHEKPSIHSMMPGISSSTLPVFDNNEKDIILGPKPLGLLRNDIEETDVSYFLIRWFAYIDVIGALSSSHASAFLTTNENMAQLWAIHDWSLARIKERGIEGALSPKISRGLSPTAMSSPVSPLSSVPEQQINFPVKIDFLLGMDLDMLPVFSKVTCLARQRRRLERKKARKEQMNLSLAQLENWAEEYKRCDHELSSEAFELGDLIISFCETYEMRRKQYVNDHIGRIVANNIRRDSLSSENGNNSHELSSEQSERKNSIQQDGSVSSPLPPTHAMLPVRVQTYSQLCVMNTTFCYSALIQLYRRVIELPTSSDLVQGVVQRVTKLMDSCIPQGSPVESCMSFPMFTTACEVLDPIEREKYWLRMKGMERFGVGQVHKARRAMELTWERNIPWVEIMEENGWEFVLA